MQGLKLTAAFLFFLVFFANSSAQSIGKIYSKTDADSLFGKVHFSQKIDAELMKKILDDTTKVAMFKISKDKLLVLDKYKKAISPDSINVGADESFYIYSKDMLKELFEKGDNEEGVYVEMRRNTLTISSGNYTLEFSYICPPFCD